MADPITGWTGEELGDAIRRAWRESVRCWQEARDPANRDVRATLTTAAWTAQDHWQRLLAEVQRRDEERRASGIALHGKCSDCSEPNAPGETMCAGHRRLLSGGHSPQGIAHNE
jgi:hypothetical protein